MARSRSAVDGVLTAAGVVGPLLFVTDWAVLGAIRSHYSPINDAISRLAETGAPTRAAMTVGFIIYGGGLVAYAASPLSGLPRAVKILLAGTGVSTFGVAAFSLDAAGRGNAHATFAGVGYATLAAAPVVAAGIWVGTADHGPWVRVSVVAGLVTAAFLIASLFAPSHGLLQRVGLTVGDAWVVATAVRALYTRRLSGAPPTASSG
ncbi:MAG: DUF998 domain-containing protein [Actinomycetota bacterium]|nr:DUF998 domain-containing protein [Actinomycetota bacterium]